MLECIHPMEYIHPRPCSKQSFLLSASTWNYEIVYFRKWAWNFNKRAMLFRLFIHFGILKNLIHLSMVKSKFDFKLIIFKFSLKNPEYFSLLRFQSKWTFYTNRNFKIMQLSIEYKYLALSFSMSRM